MAAEDDLLVIHTFVILFRANFEQGVVAIKHKAHPGNSVLPWMGFHDMKVIKVICNSKKMRAELDQTLRIKGLIIKDRQAICRNSPSSLTQIDYRTSLQDCEI